MAAVRTVLLVLLALGATGLAPGDAQARGGSHPYFNDGGALRWYHSYAEARQAAEREGKLIFIESGRPTCGMCATLCKSVLASRSIRGRIGRVAVGLVSNCDKMEPVVARLFRQNLYRPTILPLVGFVTPRGRWVTGFYGSRSVSQFSADLDRASLTLRRINTPQAAPSAPTRPAPVPAQPRSQAPACPPARVAPTNRAPTNRAPTNRAPTPPIPPREDCHDDECPDGNCGVDACLGGDCSLDPEDPCAGYAVPQPPIGQPRAMPLAAAPRTAAPRTAAPRTATPPAATPATPRATLPPTPRREVIAEGALPDPRVRSVTGRPSSSRDLGLPRTASGSPDGNLKPFISPMPRAPSAPRDSTPVRPAGTSVPIAKRKAKDAAARGQWGMVLRLTADIPELAQHAERARRWARDTLETSVRLLLAERLNPARKGLEAVATEFEGFPAAIDAERGLKALALVEELRYLSRDSAVRTSVRARAHEQMRGSRWDCLFRDAR